MSDATLDPRYSRKPPRRPLRMSWSDERVRGIVWQVLVVGLIVSVFYWLWSNTVQNLETRRIATGWGFLGKHRHIFWRPRKFLAKNDFTEPISSQDRASARGTALLRESACKTENSTAPLGT